MTHKKQKHNYTSELELKSLLIRIKNERLRELGVQCTKMNSQINRYIKLHTKLGNLKYGTVEERRKRDKLRKKISARIVGMSEVTKIDPVSYERFGDIILLMIKNILRKPQFSGYTFRDDFYSDAVYKILKYLHNFDHTMISERTGQSVNAFAYISQYIHNSIIYVINTKKKDQDRIHTQIRAANISHDVAMHNNELIESKLWREYPEVPPPNSSLKVDLEGPVLKGITDWFAENECPAGATMTFTYPPDLTITIEEFEALQQYLNSLKPRSFHGNRDTSINIQRRS